MSTQLSMPMLAVGAAFDYHAGLLEEPPRCRNGLVCSGCIGWHRNRDGSGGVTCLLTASLSGCFLLSGSDFGGRSWGTAILLWRKFDSAERAVEELVRAA